MTRRQLLPSAVGHAAHGAEDYEVTTLVKNVQYELSRLEPEPKVCPA